MRARGFTMLEVIAVLALLGIVAAVALPRVAGTTAEARRARLLDRVVALDSQCRLWARSRGAVVLHVDDEAERIRALREGSGEVLATDNVPETAALAFVTPQGDVPAIRFDALGRSVDYTIRCAADGAHLLCHVNGLTGRVSRERP